MPLPRVLESAGFDVVGQAGDAADALRKVRARRPDVAIIDIRMPPTHLDEGIRAARAIRAELPQVGVLLFSQHVEQRYATALLEYGAAGVGYLLKDRLTDVDRFADAIRNVADCGSVLDPEVVSHMLGRQRRNRTLDALSARDLEVLEQMAAGASNHAIARPRQRQPYGRPHDVGAVRDPALPVGRLHRESECQRGVGLSDRHGLREQQLTRRRAEDADRRLLPNHGDQAGRALGRRGRNVEVDAAMLGSDRLRRGLEVASGLVGARPCLAGEGDVDLDDDGACAETGNGARTLDGRPRVRLDHGAYDGIARDLMRVHRQGGRRHHECRSDSAQD